MEIAMVVAHWTVHGPYKAWKAFFGGKADNTLKKNKFQPKPFLTDKACR